MPTSASTGQLSPREGGGFPTGAGVLLGVFAKHWTPGETKTRLAKAVGPERSAESSRLFLETTLRRLQRIEVADRVVCYTPPERAGEFAELPTVASGRWRVEPQSVGSLGDRMRAYFESARQKQPAALLVGSDSPDLPLAAIDRAVALLTDPEGTCRLVLGPSEDGGYWLIGCRGGSPPVFGDLPWSGADLLEQTLACLADIGWREGAEFQLLDRWYDVDELADLTRLRARLPSDDPDLVWLVDRLDALHGPLTRD